jgi:hypothetical protein
MSVSSAVFLGRQQGFLALFAGDTGEIKHEAMATTVKPSSHV